MNEYPSSYPEIETVVAMAVRAALRCAEVEGLAAGDLVAFLGNEYIWELVEPIDGGASYLLRKPGETTIRPREEVFGVIEAMYAGNLVRQALDQEAAERS